MDTEEKVKLTTSCIMLAVYVSFWIFAAYWIYRLAAKIISL